MCQLPIGVLLDKFDVRRIGRVSTFLWSVASFGAAVAPGISGLFAARLALGVGEAPTFPANAKATGFWFPQQERSLATSIFDAAAKFASTVGVPLIGIVLIRVGWRWSFAITGMLSLLYFLLFWRIYRDPDEDLALTELERSYIAAEDGVSRLHGIVPRGRCRCRVRMPRHAVWGSLSLRCQRFRTHPSWHLRGPAVVVYRNHNI